MISHKHKFLFIHIPKTAGNSIQTVLQDYSEDIIYTKSSSQDGRNRFAVKNKDHLFLKKHSALKDYNKAFGKKLKSYYKFTCVRNPWDCMISYYFTPLTGRDNWDRETFINVVDKFITFRKYTGSGLFNNFSRDPFKEFNFIIKYEELQSGFDKVCDSIGINKVILPVRNKGSRNHYSDYYDDELIDIVARKFKLEIDYFNYKFEKRK